MHILVLHAIGAAGGLTARKLKLPAGALIGSMLAVAIVNAVAGVGSEYPINVRIAMQICSGLIIGSRLDRHSIRELKSMVVPAILLVVILLGLTVLFASMISWTTTVTFVTALFAVAPGGLTDLAIVAADFGADVQQVALLQLVRFVFVVSVFPPLMRRLYRKECEGAPAQGPQMLPAHDAAVQSRTRSLLLLALFLALATAGSLAFRYLGIPAGTLLGAIVAVVMVNLVWKQVTYPRLMRLIVQLAAGTYIGYRFGRDTIANIPALAVPMVFVIVEVFVMAFVGSFIIHFTCRVSPPTAMFSCTPGGITEMSLIAEEMGLDVSKIVVMHTVRVLATIGLVPLLVTWFS